MSPAVFKDLEPVWAASVAEFPGNRLCDRQPCKPVIVIMGCAVSAKVIKMAWEVVTFTRF